MSEPIRIGMIMGKWVGGGVEAVIMNYYRHIDRNKIQFDFICDSDSTDIPYDEIEKLGGKVILCPPYQKLFKYTKELKKIFKENNYKIVHSNINALSVFPLRAAKKVGVPIRIAHSHSTSNKKEWKKTMVKNVLRPFSKKYANRYMCCSELAGRWLFGNKEYDKGTVYLLNNAIDLDKFKYDEKVRLSKRKELGIIGDTFVVGHVGRFNEQKNHTFLLDIFAEILKIKENAVLLLIGEGELYDEVKQKAKVLGISENVVFYGKTSEVYNLMQAMDVFVFPSLFEGLPVAGVEAQAADLPFFMSDTITKELQMTDHCVYLPLQDSKKWAETVCAESEMMVRRDTRKELRANGYDINQTVEFLEELYKSLVS